MININMKILRIITGSLLLAHVCLAAETKVATPQGRPVLVNVWLDRTEFREGSLSM
jgi:hypothetical protein